MITEDFRQKVLVTKEILIRIIQGIIKLINFLVFGAEFCSNCNENVLKIIYSTKVNLCLTG